MANKVAELLGSNPQAAPSEERVNKVAELLGGNSGQQVTQPESQRVNPISALLPGGQLLDKAFGSGTGQSLMQGAGQAVADLGTGLFNTVGKLGGLTIGAPAPQLQRANISGNAPNQTAASIGEFLPYLAPGMPMARLAKGAYEAVPYIGNVLSKAPNMINAGLTAGAYGGINANADPRNGSGLNASLASGLIGAGTQGAFGLAGKGVNALANSSLGNTVKAAARPLINKYVGKLQNEALNQQGTLLKTPQQAAERLQNIGEAPISLGELIDSPNLRGIYNSSTNLPLSGQMPKIQQKVGMADDTANAAMNHLLGQEQPEAINSRLIDKLKQNYKQFGEASRAKYDIANQIAENSGINTSSRPASQSYAKQLLDEAKRKSANNELDWLSSSPEELKLLKKVAEGPKGKASLNDAIQARSIIGSNLEEARLAGDRKKASIYEKLYGTLSNDLQSSIEKANNPDLMTAWQAANQHYAENITPYMSSDIRRLLQKEDTKDLTNALLKPENSKVLSHLSDSDKRLLLYQELNKSLKQSDTGEIEPVASKLWNNYSRLVTQYPNTMKNLLTPGDHELMKKVGSLYETTKSGRPILNPPETGAKLLRPALKAAGITTAAVTGAMNPIAALAVVGGIGGGLATNRAIGNLLTNPALLKAYTETNPIARRALINQALPYKQGKVGRAVKKLNDPLQLLNRIYNPAQIGRLVGQQNQ